MFAANLAQLGEVQVWAYDLAREHVEAINERGLRLSGAGDVIVGFDHPNYGHMAVMPAAVRQALAQDFA